jgi:hypothetical protein
MLKDSYIPKNLSIEPFGRLLQGLTMPAHNQKTTTIGQSISELAAYPFIRIAAKPTTGKPHSAGGPPSESASTSECQLT